VVPIVVRKGAECTLVTIVPDTLAPGDTAAVLVMKRQTDGTVVPYPPETLFSVTLLAGQGTLIGPSGDTSSTMLECVEQGFRYVAPDSITGSSLETHISAVLAEGCGGLRPVGGQSAGKMKDKGEETPRLSLVECPVFASVVVEECGPKCQPTPIEYNLPFNFVDNQTICNNYFLGVTDPTVIPGQFHIETCLSGNKWVPKLSSFSHPINYGPCSALFGNPTDIYDACQPEITHENYGEIIHNLIYIRDYLTGEEPPNGVRYQAKALVIKHELTHAQQMKQDLPKAIEGNLQGLQKGSLVRRLKEISVRKTTPCNRDAARSIITDKADVVLSAFCDDWDSWIGMQERERVKIANPEGKLISVPKYERKAILATQKDYVALIGKIKRRFE
jgi:hypothetical protein